jgi:hypothetical protein
MRIKHITEEDEARWGDLCAFAGRAVLDPERYRGDIFMTPVIDTEGSDEALPGVVLVHRYKSGRVKAHEVIGFISRGNSFGRYLPYPDPKPVREKSGKTRKGRR